MFKSCENPVPGDSHAHAFNMLIELIKILTI